MNRCPLLFVVLLFPVAVGAQVAEQPAFRAAVVVGAFRTADMDRDGIATRVSSLLAGASRCIPSLDSTPLILAIDPLREAGAPTIWRFSDSVDVRDSFVTCLNQHIDGQLAMRPAETPLVALLLLVPEGASDARRQLDARGLILDEGLADRWYQTVGATPDGPRCPANATQRESAGARKGEKQIECLSADVVIQRMEVRADGTLAAQFDFDDGRRVGAREYWADGKPRRDLGVGAALCFARDLSRIPCGIFDPRSTPESARRVTSLLPGSTGEGAHFPFGLATVTWRRQLRGNEAWCDEGSSTVEQHGELSCNLRASDDRTLTFGAFVGEDTSVRWFATADGVLLGKVTITSGMLEDCDDMATAYASAITAVKMKYGKRMKVTQKGRHFGSTACRNYMNMKDSYFQMSDKTWSIRVGTYWSDGGYFVYIMYTLTPVTQEAYAFQDRNAVADAVDAWSKL